MMILDEARTRNSTYVAGRRLLAAILLTLGLVSPVGAEEQNSRADWREQNAYTLGVQAYIYTFPWSYMAESTMDTK
jgi:hypothetical protein